MRQHARTSLLLGVDFLPMSERARAMQAEVVGDGSAPREAGPSDPRAAKSSARDEPGERLERLRAIYERDAPHASFAGEFTSIVWGEGDPEADLMFIGEAPGAEEDRTGRPFVGRAGQLLDKMIRAMGLERERAYICNVLKTRPPGNATPTTEEAGRCAPYLFGQIAIIQPRAIVALGLPATRLLLDTSESMARLRGRWHEVAIPFGLSDEIVPPEAVGLTFPVMPTYHPAFLLRSYTKENRGKVWSDLQQAMQVVGMS